LCSFVAGKIEHKKISVISAICGEKNIKKWIPAFAGMTKGARDDPAKQVGG